MKLYAGASIAYQRNVEDAIPYIDYASHRRFFTAFRMTNEGADASNKAIYQIGKILIPF